jgi:Mg2+-importing ATPase
MDTQTVVRPTVSASATSLIQKAGCVDAAEVQSTLGTPSAGLTSHEASERLTREGANSVPAHRASAAHVLWGQVKSPLLMLLAVAAVLSMATGDVGDATIILVILGVSVSLGFWNEYKAQRTADSLQDRITHSTVVVRDGVQKEVEVSHVVRGDIVRISLGHVVPADLRLIHVTNLSCDESAITGESQPASKDTATVSGQPGLGDLPCCALMGTVVQSGSGTGIAVATGADAVFGRIAASLNQAPPVTSFQKGLAKFSQFLMWVAIALAVFIFAANTVQHRPILTGLMFALAIAVGITPQLLPAVVNTSLAAGARLLSKQHVLVKRLVCIEDLGNVDVLVTDKTGTLTNGRLTYVEALPARGFTEAAVAQLGLLSCETDFAAVGATNVGQDPLDQALAEATLGHSDLSGHARLDLRPFDHDSRTSAVLIQSDKDGRQEVIKGAPESVLALCSDVDPADSQSVDRLFDQGARVVAVAIKALPTVNKLPAADATGFTLAGYLSFSDEPKLDAKQSIDRLNALNVAVKIATGDNQRVAEKVCRDLGLEPGETLTGEVVETLSDIDLYEAAQRTSLLARVSPDQKARIIRVLRQHHSVAFLGDGVNDAPALHAADVGISVHSAVDVAKDAADIVLLDKDLGVIAEAVVDGRKVFTNTIKYVQMGTSSNFGNMFSAALASVFLPFLPMTPSQILLNNLLYDSSQLAIPTDSVDDEQLRKPSHWDIGSIRRFMLIFGPISSLFDFLTFGLMLWLLRAPIPEFQAGWFVESLATQTLIVFAIRTRRVPFWKSRPGALLRATVLGIVAVGVILPYSPLATLIGFRPLPISFLLALVGVVLVYLVVIEIAKLAYYRIGGQAVPAPAIASTAPTARLSSDERRHRHARRTASRFRAR